MTGVQQSNAFLQPLLVTSFYGTILSSVYTTETTIDSKDVRETIASCWRLDGQWMTVGQRGLDLTVGL